jgi:hypothetical protein
VVGWLARDLCRRQVRDRRRAQSEEHHRDALRPGSNSGDAHTRRADDRVRNESRGCLGIRNDCVRHTAAETSAGKIR